MEKLSVVTGATAGIGYHTALQLAGRGHRLILVFRNIDKGDQARNQIVSQLPNAKVDLVVADLSVQQQVKRAAREISQLTSKIEVLINNAGTWCSQRILTEDDIEMVFAVNHLSYFLLTHLLYPLLAASDAARIINVSSDSHYNGAIHFKNLGLKNNYHGLRSYAQSKLANVLFTYELHRRKRHDHITTNAVQPGLVKTDIGLKHTNWWHGLAWKIWRSSGLSPQKGAKTSVFLATSDEVAGISSKYWDNCQPKPSSKNSYKLKDAERLWRISEEMCGIDEYFAAN